MGDDYIGAVTVGDEVGGTLSLKNISLWGQSDTIMEMVMEADPGEAIPLDRASAEMLIHVKKMMEIVAGQEEEEEGGPHVEWGDASAQRQASRQRL